MSAHAGGSCGGGWRAGCGMGLLGDDLVAQRHAVVADRYRGHPDRGRRAEHEVVGVVWPLLAERAAQVVWRAGCGRISHAGNATGGTVRP